MFIYLLLFFLNKKGEKERPDSQAETLLSFLLQEGVWLPTRRLLACQQIDLNFLKNSVKKTIQDIQKVVFYTHGEMSVEDSSRNCEEISEKIVANSNRFNFFFLIFFIFLLKHK
jgi:hypothetical protein